MGETKCVICNFDIGVFSTDRIQPNGPNSKEITYLNFVIKREHAFIRNVFEPEDLRKTDKVKTLESYFDNFNLFLQLLALLDSSYSSESDIEDICDECVANFVEENNIESFNELYLEAKNVYSRKKTETAQFKLISYVYSKFSPWKNLR